MAKTWQFENLARIYNINWGTGGDDGAMYFFHCWGCGTLVPTQTSQPLLRVYCAECKETVPQKLDEDRRLYSEVRARLMLDRALSILERQDAHMYEYREPAQVIAEKTAGDPGAFDSAHEMIAAMELVRNSVRAKIHPSVGSYRPDFLLPAKKVVLEVDGYMHKHSKLRDSDRDIKMRRELGPEWEVVRIPTKYIEQNAKMLVKAIDELAAYKRKVRRQHSGIVPAWYSDRDAEFWEDVLYGKR